MDNQPTETLAQRHPLSNKWVLWAHLPQSTDWGVNSYVCIYTFNTVEDAIAVTETLPNVLIENGMLFLFRQGINPMWEDARNVDGGCFSYKVPTKHVCNAWKDLSYALIGNTVSNNEEFSQCINGITISPKKHFSIIKIWLDTCAYQSPTLVTMKAVGIVPNGCIFKKHTS